MMRLLSKRSPLIQFGKAFVLAIGTLQSLFFVWKEWIGLDVPDISTCTRLWAILILTIVVFLIDGWFVSGFLKQRIKLSISEGAVSLTIGFGDLFAMKGLKVIPVNSFFDSLVNESVVAASTLHGKMIERFFAGCPGEFDSQISQSLSHQRVSPVSKCTRIDNKGKTEEYETGTAAIARTSRGESFLCVALAKTDSQNNQASASLPDVYASVRGALALARSAGNGQPVVFPLLGTGLSRTGLSPMFLLNLMIQGVILENRKQKVTNEIRIVLHPSMKENINLACVENEWRMK